MGVEEKGAKDVGIKGKKPFFFPSYAQGRDANCDVTFSLFQISAVATATN